MLPPKKQKKTDTTPHARARARLAETGNTRPNTNHQGPAGTLVPTPAPKVRAEARKARTETVLK